MIVPRPLGVPIWFQFLALIFGLFFSITLFSHNWALMQSFTDDEDVFFGTPNLLSEKYWVVGLFLPGTDARPRLRFSLNGDDNASFLLYLPEPSMQELSNWFPAVATEAGVEPSHVEVHGVRISETEWVVTSLGSSYGEIDAEGLYSYQTRSAAFGTFWGLGCLGVAIAFFISIMRRALGYGKKCAVS